MIKYNQQYLYDMYNATSTDDGTGTDELETYENWLERQLISRLETIDELQANEAFRQPQKALHIDSVSGRFNKLIDVVIGIAEEQGTREISGELWVKAVYEELEQLKVK